MLSSARGKHTLNLCSQFSPGGHNTADQGAISMLMAGQLHCAQG